MNIPWEGLTHLQSFLRLDFIFSGLEVPSYWIFLARFAILLVVGGGLLYVLFRLVLRLLDCIQSLVASIASFPKSFFLILLLVIPLSPNSLGAVWTGYLLLALSLFGAGVIAAVLVIAWKYGIDKLLHVIHALKSRGAEDARETNEPQLPPDNVRTPSTELPIGSHTGMREAIL